MVGGGNSAGQAAVFLAQTARRVHMLVRSGGLAESMSRYLIRRIEETPAIVLRPHTEITALEGGDHLERVRWRDNQTGTSETHAIRHVFVMTGAVPNTRWLEGCVALDAQGFIKTGAGSVAGRSGRRALAAGPALPISSKRVCPACSRSATSGAAISSVWRRRSARDRLLSPSCIRCSTNRPTVSLDVISLVASSCWYYRSHIEQRAAHEFAVHVATQRRARETSTTPSSAVRSARCARAGASLQTATAGPRGIAPIRHPLAIRDTPVVAHGRRNDPSASQLVVYL